MAATITATQYATDLKSDVNPQNQMMFNSQNGFAPPDIDHRSSSPPADFEVPLNETNGHQKDQVINGGGQHNGYKKANEDGGKFQQVSTDDTSDTDSDTSDASTVEQIKCSAVHTMERDMPDFDYSHLVSELRQKMLVECQAMEGSYAQKDVEACKNDDWFLSRFLLRHHLDVEQAFDMLKKTMRFRHECMASHIRPEDFPIEFYQVGGVFGYEPDRKGNKMLYIRVRCHKKIPEITVAIQAFVLFNIQRMDEEAKGRGISLVFDCTGGGLANADMDILVFLISTLVNYFPKGLSYMLVHELPWILKPFWHLAKGFIPEEKRQLIKFSNSRTIYEYVDRENLPDFMGGTCKRDYRRAPDNCTTLEQAAKMWGIEKNVVKRALLKFAEFLPEESLKKLDELGRDAEDEKNDSDQENKL